MPETVKGMYIVMDWQGVLTSELMPSQEHSCMIGVPADGVVNRKRKRGIIKSWTDYVN